MSEVDTSFDVLLDGQTVRVDPLDIDGNEWATIKRETGMPAKQVLTGADELDFESLAAIVWVHVRRGEPGVELGDVLSGLSLRSLAAAGDEDEDESPSDSGVNSEG